MCRRQDCQIRLYDVQESQILRRAFLLRLVEFRAARGDPLYNRRGRRVFHLPDDFHSSRVQFTPQLSE